MSAQKHQIRRRRGCLDVIKIRSVARKQCDRNSKSTVQSISHIQGEFPPMPSLNINVEISQSTPQASAELTFPFAPPPPPQPFVLCRLNGLSFSPIVLYRCPSILLEATQLQELLFARPRLASSSAQGPVTFQWL